MFRCPRAIISRLEDLLQSSSPPIPMNIRFHHPSFSHNHPADALLEFLNTTDLLQIRLVSKSTQEWADDRLPDIFSTDHYDVTVNPNGSLSTTPANLTALQSVGKYCTHLIITISSAPSATTASTLTPVSQPPSTNSNPFIPLLSRLPSLHTLTISTPSSPTNWHALSLFPPHRPLISLRIALESAPSLSNFTTLRLWPISIMGIVSLRWHGLAAWGE
ncbi:MAG: hypothetical protein M1830_001343, partial [Pleopsidium flavum]